MEFSASLKKVLLVEDDGDIQTVARIALQSVGGFDVAIASSGQEALSLLDSFKPDVILLDVMMPGMDGPTTLSKIQKTLGQQAPLVIFITASVQAQEVETYRSLGVVDVLAKPFDPMKLADQIRGVWNKAKDACQAHA